MDSLTCSQLLSSIGSSHSAPKHPSAQLGWILPQSSYVAASSKWTNSMFYAKRLVLAMSLFSWAYFLCPKSDSVIIVGLCYACFHLRFFDHVTRDLQSISHALSCPNVALLYLNTTFNILKFKHRATSSLYTSLSDQEDHHVSGGSQVFLHWSADFYICAVWVYYVEQLCLRL